MRATRKKLLRFKAMVVRGILGFSLTWALVAGAQEASSLRVVGLDSLKMYGSMIEAMLRDAGIEPSLSFFPAARSTHMFVSGQADAEFFRVAELPDDYPSGVMKIGPLQSVRFGMYVRADDARLAGVASEGLWNQPMAYVRGTLAVERLLKEKNVKLARPVNRDQCLNMLLAKRVDICLDSERLFLTELNKTGNSGVVTLAVTVHEEPTYLLVHPNARLLEPAIRKVIKHWLDSGRWQREYMATNQRHGLPPEMSLVKYPPPP